MTTPKAWLCWSSGKDSAWTLHESRRRGEVEVTGLLTTLTEPYDRVAMHGVRREILEAQADAAGLPLHLAPIPAKCTNDRYEAAMAEALERARAEGVTHMIFGDLYLEDVRSYRVRQLEGTGFTPLFPLWGTPTAELAREMVAAGLEAYVTCLDPGKVDRALAGHRFDAAFLDALPADADPCAEKGEFHSCAVNGPMFSRPVPVTVGETVEREGFVFTDLVLDQEG